MKKKYIKLIYFFYIIAIVAVTCFFSLKILERSDITGFISLSNEEFEEPEHPYHCIDGSREPVPNCETIFDGLVVKLPITHIRTNSYGFRDFEYSLKIPDNTFRIIVLGDSITWGHGVEIEKTYTKLLESVLNARNGQTKYEVLNFGVSGYNTFEEVELFKKNGVEFHPDLIMIQYSPDDIYNRTRTQEIYEELLSDYMKEEKASHTSDISSIANHQLYDKAYKEHQKELNALIEGDFDDVWKGIETHLYELKIIANELGANISIVIVYPPAEKDRNVLEGLEKLADDYGWCIIRADGVFDKHEWSTLTLHPKDSHLNDFAHGLIAEQIYNGLISYDII